MKPISGAVIAGGKSTRMGLDKALIELNHVSFLQKAVTLISHFTDKVFISSNTDYPTIELPIIKDVYKSIGPIAGLYSILKVIPTQKVFIIPVDTPLLSKEVVQHVLDHYDVTKQIAICKTDDGLQMLVGVFDKSLLPILESQIQKKEYKLSSLLDMSNAQIIHVKIFKNQFANINTQTDLMYLKQNNKNAKTTR